MAKVRITQQWADGSATQISVKIDASYPDAVNEARANAMSMWREACISTESETDVS